MEQGISNENQAVLSKNTGKLLEKSQLVLENIRSSYSAFSNQNTYRDLQLALLLDDVVNLLVELIKSLQLEREVEMGQTSWKVGDVAIWNEEKIVASVARGNDDLRAKYGAGPFIIVKVRKNNVGGLEVQMRRYNDRMPLNFDGFLVDNELVLPIWFSESHFVKVNS